MLGRVPVIRCARPIYLPTSIFVRLPTPARSPTIPLGSKPFFPARSRAPGLSIQRLENYPELVERWARLRPLLGNSADVLCRVRQPQIVAEARGGSACRIRRLPIRWATHSHPAIGFASGFARPAACTSSDSRTRTGQPTRPKIRLRAVIIFNNSSRALRAPPFTWRPAEGPCCRAVTRQLTGLDWTGAVGFQYCGSIGPLRPRPLNRGIARSAWRSSSR